MKMNAVLAVVATLLINQSFAQEPSPPVPDTKTDSSSPAAESPAKSEPRADLDYRSIRREAAGREHAQIKTPRGTIFYHVKILRIDNHRVSIIHQDGRALLEYDSIPAEWINEFNIVDKKKKGRPSASKANKVVAAPAFDFSGKITISGDQNSGQGILVKSGETYYIYTDCATISGNSKISMQSTNGMTLRMAKVIECAEGTPLARIQVQLPGDGIKPVTLAAKDAGSKLQAHQYLYPLKEEKEKRPMKVSSVATNSIEVSSRLNESYAGLAIMMASNEAIGFILGQLPQNQSLRNTTKTRFKSQGVQVARLDIEYTWKKTRLKDFLSSQQRILAFDKKTQLYKALGECQHSGGKIQIPSSARFVFKEHSKDRRVMELLKFAELLDKKTMRPNEKEVQRKFEGIVGTAMRSAKKQTAAMPLKKFDWYHQHFLKESIEWRERLFARLDE